MFCRVFQRSGYLARDMKTLFDLTSHGLRLPFAASGPKVCCTSGKDVIQILKFDNRIDIQNGLLQSQNTFVIEVMSIKYLRKLLDGCATGWV